MYYVLLYYYYCVSCTDLICICYSFRTHITPKYTKWQISVPNMSNRRYICSIYRPSCSQLQYYCFLSDTSYYLKVYSFYQKVMTFTEWLFLQNSMMLHNNIIWGKKMIIFFLLFIITIFVKAFYFSNNIIIIILNFIYLH